MNRTNTTVIPYIYIFINLLKASTLLYSDTSPRFKSMLQNIPQVGEYDVTALIIMTPPTHDWHEILQTRFEPSQISPCNLQISIGRLYGLTIDQS